VVAAAAPDVLRVLGAVVVEMQVVVAAVAWQTRAVVVVAADKGLVRLVIPAARVSASFAIPARKRVPAERSTRLAVLPTINLRLLAPSCRLDEGYYGSLC